MPILLPNIPKIFSHLLPPPQQRFWSRHPLHPRVHLVDWPFRNLLSNSVLLPSNLIIYRTQSLHLQSLSDGWLHPSVIGVLQGIFTCHLTIKLIVESPHFLEESGVTTQVFYPNSRTAWENTLKNVPDVLSYVPSIPIICDIYAHLFLAFLKLTTIYGQSLPMSNIRWMGCFNYLMLSMGWT